MRRYIAVVLVVLGLTVVSGAVANGGIVLVERFEGDEIDASVWEVPADSPMYLEDGKLVYPGHQSDLYSLPTIEEFERTYAARVIFEMDIPDDLEGRYYRPAIGFTGEAYGWLRGFSNYVSFAVSQRHIGVLVEDLDQQAADYGMCIIEYDYSRKTERFDVAIGMVDGEFITVVVREMDGNTLAEWYYEDYVWQPGTGPINLFAYQPAGDIRWDVVVVGLTLDDVLAFEVE